MKTLFILILSIISFNLYSQDAVLAWAFSQGSSTTQDADGYESGESITVDQYNNVIVVGAFSGSVDFNPGVDSTILTTLEIGSVFIQKLDSSGHLLWVKKIGSFSRVNSVDTDHEGNIYIIGDFLETIDFDPGLDTVSLTSHGDFDIFILKLNPDGEFLWAKSMGGDYQDKGNSISIDSYGNVFSTGFYEDYAYFDSEIDSSIHYYGGRNIFIQKLNSNGDFQWVKTFGAPILGFDNGYAVSIDNNEDIFVFGQFRGEMDFDPGPSEELLICDDVKDLFILKLNNDGEFIWVKQLSGNGSQFGHSITVDNDGNIIAIGTFTETMDFDPGPEINEITQNGLSSFVLKLDADGNLIWVNAGDMFYYSLEVKSDVSGNLYIIGEFGGDTVDFDPGFEVVNLTSLPTMLREVFILKLNSNGNFVWVKQITGEYNIQNGHICIDNTGNLYTTGRYETTIDLDPGIDSLLFTSEGYTDIFVQKLSQDTCYLFGINVDASEYKLCNSPGFISASSYGGTPPYNYSWNTNPPTLDSLIILESGGVYTLSVVDNIGCTRNISTLIESPNINAFEMDVNLIAEGFRPGFKSGIILDAKNYGCTLVEGSIKLVINELVSLNDSLDQPDVVLGDTLIWHYMETNFDSSNVIFNFELLTSTEAVIGDTICFDLSISPLSGDADSTNNYKHYCFPVLNGYDPNDKQVYPQGICDGHFVLKTDPLTYTIRFQNTGNAEAINIHIMDSLSNYLDINTVEILGSSHDMYTLIRPGNVLDFMFDDIWLPDSTSNEPESHGYVIYKVHPNSFIYNGTYVDNKAEIYFDYNPPIVTNTVFNTLVNELLTCDINMGVDEKLNSVNELKVYPNPSNGIFNVETNDLTNASIKVFNLNGKQVYFADGLTGSKHIIRLNEHKGMYILELNSNGERQYYKLMNE